MFKAKLLYNDIKLKECGLICPNATLDPLYKNLTLFHIFTVNQLLTAYEQDTLPSMRCATEAQLDGLIDLLNFQYFKETSNEIIRILDTPIMKSSSFSSILDKKEEYLLHRLGLNSSQIRTFKEIIKNHPTNQKIIFYLQLNDFLDISRNDSIVRTLKTKISLLKEMYQSLEKGKEKETTSYSSTIPNEERDTDIGKIRIENLGFLPLSMNESPVYKICMMCKYYTVGDVFQACREGKFSFSNKEDYLYLEGIIDLIRFQYYDEPSHEILSLLNKNISLEKRERERFLSLESKKDLKRLGFSKNPIKWIEEKLVNLLDENRVMKFIDFFREEQKDTHSFSLGTIIYSYYYTISLLIKMYQLYYSPENVKLKNIADLKISLGNLIEKAAFLAKNIQEVQEEIASLQREDEQIKLNKEKNI